MAGASVLFLAAFSLALLRAAAGQSASACIPEGAFDPTINYFSTAFAGEAFALPISLTTSVRNAYNFTVQYGNSYKIVKDTHAGTTYVLRLCGAPPPALNFAVNGSLDIALAEYGIYTTVPLNFLQLLGVVGGLRRLEDGPAVDPCMQRVVAGLPSAGAFNGTMINAQDPSTTAYNAPNVSFSAAQDPGVLSRAEWIKYLALFFNREDAANAVFQNISAAYQCLNGSAPASDPKPLVGWLNFYNGTWTLSGAAYKRQLTEDAGGAMPPEAANGERYFDMSSAEDEAAFKTLLAALDVVVDETFLPGGPPTYSLANFTANAGLTPEEAQGLRVLAQGRESVWSIYGTYAPPKDIAKDFAYTAWYESAVAQPQVVLEELLAILHPSLFPSGLQHTYLFNVGNGQAKAVTAASCTAADPTAPVGPTAVFCPERKQPSAAVAVGPTALGFASLLLAALMILI